MAAWLHQLLITNLMASVLIALVCVLRHFGRRTLGSRWLYSCWLPVALRLLLPVTVTVPEKMQAVIAPPLDLVSAYVPAIPMNQALEAPIEVGVKSASLSPAVVLGGIWLIVSATIGVMMVLRNVRFRKALHMRGLTEGETTELAACAARHDMRLPYTYTSAHIQSPCLVGGIRPRLVVPQGMSFYDEDAGFALLHEACHARVGDTRWACLRAALCCLHWFNPLVWIAARLSAIDAELACDMRVMARLRDNDRYAYARVLVDAAQRRTFSVLGVSFAERPLQTRITQILEGTKVKKAWIAMSAVLMVIALGASFAVSDPDTAAQQNTKYDWWIPAGKKEGTASHTSISGAMLHEDPQNKNLSLQEIWDTSETYQQKNLNSILAKVVDKETGDWPQMFTIDVGSENGIEVNMAVVNVDGLIGYIYKVNDTTSQVISIIDDRAGVAGIIQSTRDQGMIKGTLASDDESTCRMYYLPVDMLPRPGDVVVTSGIGAPFPKGIKIGVVRESTRYIDENKHYVVIEPVVDFTLLEEVMVLL